MVSLIALESQQYRHFLISDRLTGNQIQAIWAEKPQYFLGYPTGW
jgi:hypothetical protein